MPDADEKCGHPTTGGGTCDNPATESDGSCWLSTHGDDPADSEPDGRGAPAGNRNAAKTGLHMGIKERMKWFRELGDPWESLFEDYYVEYTGKAENKSQAARLASYAVIADRLENHLHTEGLFYRDTIGDPDELGDDAFVQKPKIQTLEALKDSLTELRLGQKYEGISGGRDSGSSGHTGKNNLWEATEESGEV